MSCGRRYFVLIQSSQRSGLFFSRVFSVAPPTPRSEAFAGDSVVSRRGLAAVLRAVISLVPAAHSDAAGTEPAQGVRVLKTYRSKKRPGFGRARVLCLSKPGVQSNGNSPLNLCGQIGGYSRKCFCRRCYRDVLVDVGCAGVTLDYRFRLLLSIAMNSGR